MKGLGSFFTALVLVFLSANPSECTPSPEISTSEDVTESYTTLPTAPDKSPDSSVISEQNVTEASVTSETTVFPDEEGETLEYNTDLSKSDVFLADSFVPTNINYDITTSRTLTDVAVEEEITTAQYLDMAMASSIQQQATVSPTSATPPVREMTRSRSNFSRSLPFYNSSTGSDNSKVELESSTMREVRFEMNPNGKGVGTWKEISLAGNNLKQSDRDGRSYIGESSSASDMGISVRHVKSSLYPLLGTLTVWKLLCIV